VRVKIQKNTLNLNRIRQQAAILSGGKL
jgi:hypothetical protein